jgi:hypothetical protein
MTGMEIFHQGDNVSVRAITGDGLRALEQLKPADLSASALTSGTSFRRIDAEGVLRRKHSDDLRNLAAVLRTESQGVRSLGAPR